MPQRPPVTFWLLLAATLCVDAVAAFWIFINDFDEMSATLFLALVYGELSAYCAWAILAHDLPRWRWLQPFIGGLAAGLLSAAASEAPGQAEHYVAFIGLFWLHVVLALAVLWGWKSQHRAWRFSIANLLVLTTASAVLLSLLGRNELLLGEIGSVLTIVLGNFVLLVAVLATRYYELPLLLRVALNCGVAILVGSLWEAFGLAFANFLNLVALYLIQMLTLSLWLAFTRLSYLDSSKAI